MASTGTMKKGIIASAGILVGGIAVGLPVAANRYEAKAAPGAKVGPIVVAGLTRNEAEFKLRTWWETEKTREITLAMGPKDFTARPSQLGLTLDDKASIEQVEFRDFWEAARDTLDKSKTTTDYGVKFKNVKVDTAPLRKFVADNSPPRTPARAYYRSGSIRFEPEIATQKLDADKLASVVEEAFRGDGKADMPLVVAPKMVPDEDLKKIREVVAEYTTKFSEGNRPRASNIRLASQKIDGIVLAPGETFSYNESVGRRTVAAGFKEAGVFADGRHDTGIGGGICQVSTTLYNAALFADLKIAERLNHSMPVPYVPVGRDATVDYGNIDLKIVNSHDTPIAISVSVASGTLSFRVLGQKTPGKTIEVLGGGVRSWSPREEIVRDPNLAAGVRRVIEGGVSGRSTATWRVVKVDGKEVRRDSLGQSYYRGGRRIVAVGTRKAPAPKPVQDAPKELPVAPTGEPDAMNP